jgi:hypothetical protein
MSRTHTVTELAEATKMSPDEINRAGGFSIESETIRVEGEPRNIRRVFNLAGTARDYARVGWVMDKDVEKCMTCCKKLWFFHDRVHCHACGNINCADCASNICLVEELPDLDHGVPVCSHCFWGQDPVRAWIRDASTTKNTNGVSPTVVAQVPKTVKTGGISIQDTKSQMMMDTKGSSGSQSQRSPSNKSAVTNVPIKDVRVTKDSTSDMSVGEVGDDEEVHEVTPLFVIKTKRVKSSEKVFVNVGTPEMFDLLSVAGAPKGILVNGSVVESEDKSGDTCFIFDVLINTVKSSSVSYDMATVQDWIEDVASDIIYIVNTECRENLDLVLKFPKIKGNYKGTVVKMFTCPKSSLRKVFSQYQTSLKPPVKKGWLKKQRRGGMIKNWKERYFVLSGGELSYFEGALEVPPFGELLKGNVDLTGAVVEDKDECQFIVVGKVGQEKNLVMEADTMANKISWMKAINRHIAFTKN